jgi:hypothetical protein
MPLTVQPLPFGLRDVKLTPYLAGGETLGTTVDLPVARTLSFAEAEDFEELRGDDKTVAYRGKGASINWSLESGGVSLEAWAVLAGGTITSTGTTPAQVKKLQKKVTDSRPYFKIEGQMISDSGGDFHCVIYKARATGDIGGDFGNDQFFLTACDGIGIPMSTDILYDIVQNETAVASVSNP